VADPRASVIILGWGGEPYIADCLAALRRQSYRAVEVIVVDNGSPDGTAEIVERDFSEVRLIRTEQNLGVAGGNNVGLRAAQGELCILINADVEAHPGWLSHLVGAMEADPRIGIAGAKLLYPDGTIQFAGGRIDPPRGYPSHLGRHEVDRGQFDTATDVEFVTGASLAIRRSILDRIGYEDERFFPIDLEDVDMSYRARAAGFRVVLAPQAVATHHESSTARAQDLGRALSLEAGRVRFVCKYWPAARLRRVPAGRVRLFRSGRGAQPGAAQVGLSQGAARDPGPGRLATAAGRWRSGGITSRTDGGAVAVAPGLPARGHLLASR